MAQDKTTLLELTPEGFNCFKAVFNALNSHLNNIHQTHKETTSYTQQYN